MTRCCWLRVAFSCWVSFLFSSSTWKGTGLLHQPLATNSPSPSCEFLPPTAPPVRRTAPCTPRPAPCVPLADPRRPSPMGLIRARFQHGVVARAEDLAPPFLLPTGRMREPRDLEQSSACGTRSGDTPAAGSPLQTADEEGALLGRGRGHAPSPSPFKQPALGVRYLLGLLSLQDLELLHLSRGEHKGEKEVSASWARGPSPPPGSHTKQPGIRIQGCVGDPSPADVAIPHVPGP